MKFIKKDQTGLYAMGKEAHHLLGDVSRDKWDLIIIFKEDKESYYGNWVFGYGLVDVRFSKKSIKQLNKKELRKYDDTGYGISGAFINMLKVKEYLWKKSQ